MKKWNKGLTLVEVLVTSALGIILAVIAIMIFSMYNSQLRENNIYLKLQIQYENVAEQIGFNARKAKKVIESSSPFYDTCSSNSDTVTSVRFWNCNGSVFAGYRIIADTLQEFDSSSGTWNPYVAGNGIVTVGMGSNFVLGGCRKSISMSLLLKGDDLDTTYYLSPRMDEFLCRN